MERLIQKNETFSLSEGMTPVEVYTRTYNDNKFLFYTSQAGSSQTVVTQTFDPVTRAQPEVPVSNLTPTDPLFADQWHFGSVGSFNFLGDVERIWDEYNGAGVAVGVYDTGIEITHTDLVGSYDPALMVLINGVAHDPSNIVLSGSSSHHGTAISGLIAAEFDPIAPGEGVVGLAWGARLGGVNVLSDPATGPNIETNIPDFLESLDMNMAGGEDGFDVINHSYGLSFPDFDDSLRAGPTGHDAVVAKYLSTLETGRDGLGTLHVNAAGNSALSFESANANGYIVTASRGAITVGAHDDGTINPGTPKVSLYSNWGANLLLSAPSSAAANIESGDPWKKLVTTDLSGAAGTNSGDYTTDGDDGFGGTSGSAPLVTATVALMLEANPSLGWRDVQKILAYSAQEVGSGVGSSGLIGELFQWQYNGADDWNGGGLHFSEDYGFGSVHTYNSVRMAEVWSLFGPSQGSIDKTASGNSPEIIGEDSFTVDFNIPSGTGISGNGEDPGAGSGGGRDETSTGTSGGTPSGTETVFSVNVSNDFEIEYISVNVDLSLTGFNGLTLKLYSPDNPHAFFSTTDSGITLVRNNGSFNTATAGWEWDFGVAGYRGQNAAGTWQISVELAGTGSGLINDFSLTFYGRDNSQSNVNLDDDVYHYTDEVFDALANAPGRENLTDSAGTDWLNMAAMTGNLSVNLNAGQSSTSNGQTFLTIQSGTSIEHVVTGDGNDVLTGNGLANELYGMRGGDTINGGAGNDIIDGGASSDTLNGEGGNDTIIGGAGADTITGGSGNDTIDGNGSRDVIHGNDGNDTIDGGGDRDTIFGDAGSDLLIGGQASDTIRGGDGNDQIEGRQGSDFLYGGNGDDFIIGNGLVDVIYGENGNDTLRGDGGNDSVYGGDGEDTINGGGGNDTLYGGLHNDSLIGGGQDDILFGEAGDDELSGGGGEDTLVGGAGIDDLFGNADSDKFVFAPGHDDVTIHDFQDTSTNDDQIDLTAFGFLSVAEATSFMSQVGSDVVFVHTTDTLTILNTTISDISDDLILMPI